MKRIIGASLFIIFSCQNQREYKVMIEKEFADSSGQKFATAEMENIIAENDSSAYERAGKLYWAQKKDFQLKKDTRGLAKPVAFKVYTEFGTDVEITLDSAFINRINRQYRH